MFISEVRKMRTIEKNTTLVGVSELRTNFDEILEKAKGTRVIIEKRKKFMAVLMDMEKYEKMERMLDAVEDIMLGYLAREREKDSDLSDYIDIEEL